VYSVCGCCTGSCQLEHACTSEYVSVTADRHKCPSVSCSVWEGTCSPLVCKEKGTAHLRCASSSQTGVTSRDRQMECRQGAQAGRQVDEETQAGRQAGRQADRQTDGQTGGQTDGRTDGQTDRQTSSRWTLRWTDRYKKTDRRGSLPASSTPTAPPPITSTVPAAFSSALCFCDDITFKCQAT
jgi:hypothetical protein